ncbi:MAG TPA: DNA mismatch repair protein MutS, partial [Candidatus Cloacimonadota bacterium]|nr:DNA mismatch repair protein MutS [Candidatus Cloacimonadota bacterium]
SLRDDNLSHITSIHYYSLSSYMQLDEITRRNLELTHSMRYGNRNGSLIDILDKTQTPMGSRLLHQWLMNPLLDKAHILYRQDMVETFTQSFALTEDLRLILKDIGDLSRLLSKVGAQRINPRETVALGNYLANAPHIRNLLTRYDSSVLSKIAEEIPDFSSTIGLIENAISDNPPMAITEGNIFKLNYNADLDELRTISRDGKGWIARLEAEERQKTGIPSLKIGYNKVFGYYIEVTSSHIPKVPDYYIRKQTLVNCERYISPQLKEYESKVLGAEERIKSLEYELFKDIRLKVTEHMDHMQSYVEKIAELDVLSTFAFHAYHKNYIRPIFTDSGEMEMTDCRHPVIEQILTSEAYIPNDVRLDDEENKIAIITGPNMAGKSTYLRQIGLLVIMAQMGSFIPAKTARLPIFDKVFTRVGASDNLAMGQSTFLVEMVETANILNSATVNSLILLDEIGRGTSTFDGLSLAWAIVEFIHKYKKAKTLFATHYHELTELENVLPGVRNYNIAVREWNEQMIFLRKIEPGGVDQSYGIQVARLAGLPEKVIKRAKDILRNLEDHELSPQGLTAKIKKQLGQRTDQMNIFEVIVEKTEEKDKLLTEIKDLDMDQLSPMEAWQKLKELQDKIE